MPPAATSVIDSATQHTDCGKSRDDLLRCQTRASGLAPDCHNIRQRVAIQILERDRPPYTNVIATDDPKQTAWPDTHLPVSLPPSATTLAARPK
jgi:hypothetical protein